MELHPAEKLGGVAIIRSAERPAQDHLVAGVSTHNRVWLNSMIPEYPRQMEVVLFPYTAATREMPNDSVFDAIRKHDVGVFGIKPFADTSLFRGNSAPRQPHRAAGR
jgi:hypothetical protein